MKIAVVYSDKKVYVEFRPEKFLTLLKDYLRIYKDLDVAMEQIVKDIKKAALKK